MKVLWITNLETEDIARYNGSNSFFGGWLNYSARKLLEKGADLYIACATNNVFFDVEISGITYYSYNEENCITEFEKILENVKPDIIHVWGSEYKHSLIAYEVASKKNLENKVVVSIQGLIDECSRHYTDGLPEAIVNKKTFYEAIKKDSIVDKNKEMENRGKYEAELFRKAKYCIGRTKWDYDHVLGINPKITYFLCNEILRESFYEEIPDRKLRKKHTIFLSQANYPIKGFHNFLIELPNIVKKYPDTTVRISGKNEKYKKHKTIKELIKTGTYARYINRLLVKYDLYKHISFLGIIDEKHMREEYINADVFVCPSTIENSSNSVCEAMLSGVPVVAARVGGLTTLIDNGINGILYKPYENGTLSDAVLRIFDDPNYGVELGKNAREKALAVHDPDKNTEDLMNIYKNIILNG